MANYGHVVTAWTMVHNFSATTHARLKAASGCDEKTPKNDFRTARLEPRMDTYLSTSWISPFFDYRTAVASTRRAGRFGSSTSATSDAEEERVTASILLWIVWSARDERDHGYISEYNNNISLLKLH